MNPVQKALWYIESHFSEELSLEQLARMSGASPYYLTRAFAVATGFSVMRYVRARRLTQAARALCNGGRDILSIALDAGYGSHEAFTRAFREQFGRTPEAVRAQGSCANLSLVEPIVMNSQPLENLAHPRFENGKSFLVAGISERYNCEQSGGIPSQWQRFAPHIGRVSGQIGAAAYGVRYNDDEAGNFDYLCGVEVADFSRTPAEFARLRIPAQRYAVFPHRDHISAIRRTWAGIYDGWFSTSGYALAETPTFERYGPEFDGRTGLGGFEIWIPIRA